MPLRGVFFDLYGTLLVYGDMTAAWEDWLDALCHQLSRWGLNGSAEWLAGQADGFFSRPEPPVAADGLTVYERRLRSLTTELGLALNRGQLRVAAQVSVNAWQRHILPDPEAIPVLGALRADKVLALVSNFDHPPHLYQLLNRHDLSEPFSSVVVSGEVGVKKPDPEIFSTALAATGLEPREVAYVGDSDEDMQAALAGGLVPIRIIRSDDIDPALLADYSTARNTSSGPYQSAPSVIPATGASSDTGPDSVTTVSRLSDLVTMFAENR